MGWDGPAGRNVSGQRVSGNAGREKNTRFDLHRKSAVDHNPSGLLLHGYAFLNVIVPPDG